MDTLHCVYKEEKRTDNARHCFCVSKSSANFRGYNYLCTMLQYSVILLLLVNASLSHSECCEEEMRTKSLLETASYLISRAKSSVPSCSGNQACPKEHLDCADLYENGYNKSGIYSIVPVNRLLYKKNIQVYCDMETDGGGWTVIQRRGNFGRPDDFFYKDWESYKKGFGSLGIDFWIGNDNIFALTNQKPYSIRFDLEDKDKKRLFAKYDSFLIDGEYNNYTIHISGYSGNAGDCMALHNVRPFTTKDRPNALKDGENCATKYKGGWWYKSCYCTNLNGLYKDQTDAGIDWSLPTRTGNIMVWTEMKIRPEDFGVKSATTKLKLAKTNSVNESYLTDVLFPNK